jgi:hypothetical protein
LFFRKYLLRKLKILFLKLKDKYMKNNSVKGIEDETLTSNKILSIVDKYTDILILFVFLCLIWIKLLSIYFIDNLAAHIDNYVVVYNSMKKSSIMLFTKIKIINSKSKILNNNNKKFKPPFHYTPAQPR